MAATQVRVPFSFSWQEMRPWYINRDGMVYGVLFVDPFSKRNLLATGRAPLDESSWDHPLPAMDTPMTIYWLVAVAKVDTVINDKIAKLQTRLFMINRLADRPEDFWEEPAVDTLWGRVGGEASIVGTSGGCVYAAQYGPGVLQPVAIQSRWVKGSRHIAAPLIRPLPQIIGEEILRERRHPE